MYLKGDEKKVIMLWEIQEIKSSVVELCKYIYIAFKILPYNHFLKFMIYEFPVHTYAHNYSNGKNFK